jgi:predicted restriction endonuclease
MAKIPSDAAQYLLEQAASYGDYEDKFIDADFDSAPLNRTTREAIKMARIGQGKFRESLIKRWAGQCAVTGLKNQSLLVASHIEPWSLSSNYSRLDTDNGLLLAVHIDKLFDYGLISFKDDGTLIAKQCLTVQERCIFGLNIKIGLRNITKGNVKYLERHRKLHNF